jgi:hypothetical protein
MTESGRIQTTPQHTPLPWTGPPLSKQHQASRPRRTRTNLQNISQPDLKPDKIHTLPKRNRTNSSHALNGRGKKKKEKKEKKT